MVRSLSQRSAWWLLPAFVATAFIVFWPTLQWTPFSDDHSAIWNSGVRGIPWRTGFFRPLSDLTFRIGHSLFGTAPEAHRAFNIAVHGLNAFLLFALCRQWTGSMVGFIAGVLFLAYPFHQESIVWLVGRESALGTTAILLGLVVAGSALSMHARTRLMAVTMFLGALCYESALLLLPLSLVIAWSRIFTGWPHWRPLLARLGLGVLLHFLLRTVSNDLDGGGYLLGLAPDGVHEFITRIPKALARLFLPPEPDTSTQLVRATVLFVALIAACLLIKRSQAFATVRKRLVLLLLLLVVACAVAFVAGVSTVTSESDRFLYLPSAFLCAMYGLVLSRVQSPILRWGAFVLLFLIGMGAMRTNHANWKYASHITERCLRVLPPIPSNGRLWVHGLPGEHAGAFIFRNGFCEAVDLSGRDGSRIIVVPRDIPLDRVLQSGILHKGEHVLHRSTDRHYRWEKGRYSIMEQP